jgi:hypothetical protein
MAGRLHYLEAVECFDLLISGDFTEDDDDEGRRNKAKHMFAWKRVV